MAFKRGFFFLCCTEVMTLPMKFSNELGAGIEPDLGILSTFVLFKAEGSPSVYKFLLRLLMSLDIEADPLLIMGIAPPIVYIFEEAW